MSKQPTEITIRERHDVMFRLWYSYWVERIAQVLNRRLDTAINVVAVAVGCCIAAGTGFGGLLGVVVAVLGACNLAGRFGRRAQVAKEQAYRYNVLITESGGLSTEALLARLLEIEKGDSPVPWCPGNLACNRACMSMGLGHRESLSLSEKIIASLTVGASR
ncbi:TPA: hypothetical protein ACH9TM_005342 [Escherichia coli]